MPYDESLDGETRDTEAAPTQRQAVDARAWLAERSPRGAASPDAKLAIKQTGPSLDDAPPADGPLPAIVMPKPERRPTTSEPYDDEVTALRPFRLPAPLPSSDEADHASVDDADDDAPKR